MTTLAPAVLRFPTPAAVSPRPRGTTAAVISAVFTALSIVSAATLTVIALVSGASRLLSLDLTALAAFVSGSLLFGAGAIISGLFAHTPGRMLLVVLSWAVLVVPVVASYAGLWYLASARF